MPTSIYAVTHRHNTPDDHQYKACAYVEDDELRHRSRTWVIPGTRQRYCADLTAVLEGVRILAETLHTSGYVYTSNRFASSAVNDWGHRWEELSWITPDGRVRINSDIIRTIRQSISLAREDGIAIQVVRAQPQGGLGSHHRAGRALDDRGEHGNDHARGGVLPAAWLLLAGISSGGRGQAAPGPAPILSAAGGRWRATRQG